MKLEVSGYGKQAQDWKVDKDGTENYSRVYYIRSGRVEYRDDREQRPLFPGRMYVFPAHQNYSIRHDPDDPIVCLWFHIDFFPYHFDRLLEFDPEAPENASLRGLLAAFCAEIQGKADLIVPIQNEFYLAMTEALALYIYRHPAVHKDEPLWVEVLEFIKNQLASPGLDVVSVSRRFGYTPEHFIRRFREHMNVTPYQYLTSLRMARAVKMLMAGRPVGEVALGCGYRDGKTFARTFRNFFGVPPSKYVRFYRPQA